MSDDRNSRDSKQLKKIVKEQKAEIKKLEEQLDYFKKRFTAAKQAAAWLESKLKWNHQNSYGT